MQEQDLADIIRSSATVQTLPPYADAEYSNAPAKDKNRLRSYNSQWLWLNVYAPDLRERYRYLEHGAFVNTPHGRVFVQAGGIVPKSAGLLRQRMAGASGAIVAGHSSHTNLDGMVSLRPVSRRIYRKGKDGSNSYESAVRFANVSLGKVGERVSMLVPYGRLVYILRHPNFSPVFPLTYEPIEPLAASKEIPPITIEVRQREIDEVVTMERGIEIQEMAIDLFNEAFQRGESPDSVTVKLDGGPAGLEPVSGSVYNTWAPENLRVELIEPTYSYEKDYDNFEYYLKPGRTHYANNFEAELDYFDLGNVEET